MKTYKELLAEVRADNPDLSYRECQTKAKNLIEDYSANPNAEQKEDVVVEEVVAEEPAEKPVGTPVPEPVSIDHLDVPRCKILEAEIRGREVTLERIQKILESCNVPIHVVNGPKKNQVAIESGNVRVPLAGFFEVV